MTQEFNKPDVSIVFTNWNVRDLLRDCLRSVYEKTKDLTYEIIVVDDGSTDGSVEMLRREFPEVKLVINERNLGVAKSYNRGVAVTSGRFIQMLNTDMVLINNAIKILMDFLENHPEAAACAGKLRNRDMSPQISYGSFPSFTQALVDVLFIKELLPFLPVPSLGVSPDDSITEPIEVEYLSGADMMIRREVIEKIGFFDELYTSYCEETDFCYRILHKTNWKLFFVPAAEIVHFGGMSFQHVREYQLQLLYSSYNKFFKKHHGVLYSVATRWLYALQYSIRFIFRVLAGLMERTEEKKQKIVEAFWHVKYSLFPKNHPT